MKRIIIIAAAVLALAACSKDTEVNFKKGQVVTLNVTAAIPETKVSSALNSDGQAVDFKWEEGDEIKVTVGTESAVFTLESGAGTNTATFTGEMPGSGDTFDMQYPFEDPVLTAQICSKSEAIPHDMMKFAATSCKVDNPTFSLTAQTAALRLNLYGEEQTISKIVVTNTTSTDASKPIYTLTIEGGKPLSSDSDNPTPFFIVVPAGDWNFSAGIYDSAVTPCKICTLTKTSTKEYFTAAKVLSMPAVKVENTDPVLLPGVYSVSDTKKVQFTRANLWWGKRGAATTATWHIEYNQPDYPAEWDANHIGHLFFTPSEYASYAETYVKAETMYSTDVPFFAESKGGMTVDGQAGLYALTGGDGGEWTYILKSRTNAKNLYKTGVTVTDGDVSYTKCLILAPDDYSGTALSEITDWSLSNINTLGLVCLAAAGCRDDSDKTLDQPSKRGYYWSSNAGEQYHAYCLQFTDDVNSDYTMSRIYGRSIRLVATVE